MIFLIMIISLMNIQCLAASEVKQRIEIEELIPLGISELEEGWTIRQREKTFSSEKIEDKVRDYLKKTEQDPKIYEFNLDDYLHDGNLLKKILETPKITKKEADASGVIFNSNNHKRGEVILFCTPRGNCYYGVVLLKVFWGPDKGKWLIQDRQQTQILSPTEIGKNPANDSLIYRNPLLKDFAQYNSDFILAQDDEGKLEAAAQMLWKFFLYKDHGVLVKWIKPVAETFHELFGTVYPSVVQWMQDLTKNGNRKAFIQWYDQTKNLSASKTVKKVLLLLQDMDIKKIKKEFNRYEEAKKKLTVKPFDSSKENKKDIEGINALIMQLESELKQLKISQPIDFSHAISQVHKMLERIGK